MNQPNFAFLKAEWPDLHAAASRAEALAYPDPRTACFYARRALEVAVHWLYKHDASLRLNETLTPTDLSELERMLVEAGIGTSSDVQRAKQESNGLGLFIRSLIGLDREAAKRAFGQFLSGRNPTANQIEFVGLIIDHLTERGVMDASRLYESPFTDISPRGPEGVFTSAQIDALILVLAGIQRRAAAA